MPLGGLTYVGSMNHILDGGADPQWEGALSRGNKVTIVTSAYLPQTNVAAQNMRVTRQQCGLLPQITLDTCIKMMPVILFEDCSGTERSPTL